MQEPLKRNHIDNWCTSHPGFFCFLHNKAKLEAHLETEIFEDTKETLIYIFIAICDAEKTNRISHPTTLTGWHFMLFEFQNHMNAATKVLEIYLVDVIEQRKTRTGL